MRHKLAILTILLVLGGFGAGLWRALHPPIGAFLVPGATDIQVIEIGTGVQLITYHAPGTAYAWRAMVEHNLVRRGWVHPSWWHPGPPDLSYIYWSDVRLGVLWSQIELHGEPNEARITIRRWVEPPWWWDVPWQIGGDIRPVIDKR